MKLIDSYLQVFSEKHLTAEKIYITIALTKKCNCEDEEE